MFVRSTLTYPTPDSGLTYTEIFSRIYFALQAVTREIKEVSKRADKSISIKNLTKLIHAELLGLFNSCTRSAYANFITCILTDIRLSKD